MTIDFAHYIATNNPKAANDFVVKNGLARPKDIPELLHKMQYIMQNKKGDAFVELAQIDTPYKRLLQDFSENKSGACGCSGVSSFDGEEKSNCSGCTKKSSADGVTDITTTDTATHPTTGISLINPLKTAESGLEKHLPLITVAVLAGVLGYLIAKK
jgi:hypothetical protein